MKTINKVKMVIAVMIIMLTSACGDIGNVKPIDGDSRTINQMTNEASENIENAIECGIFNCIWTKD